MKTAKAKDIKNWGDKLKVIEHDGIRHSAFIDCFLCKKRSGKMIIHYIQKNKYYLCNHAIGNVLECKKGGVFTANKSNAY